MLIQLNIRQFGIIENSSIEFKSGLTVLSGETGSGKSMILSAISQLAGHRTVTSYIRHGEDKAIIEGIFDLPKNNNLIEILEELGLDNEEDTIIIRRDIYVSGKSVCRVNGNIVNLSTLKKIAVFLIDIHEQHDNQILLVEKNHISLLDSYGKKEIEPLLKFYKEKYDEYKSLTLKINKFRQEESDILQKLDFLTYQHKEISDLELSEDIYKNLLEERDYLENYEKINSLIVETSSLLKKDGGVISSLYKVKENIAKLSGYNNSFEIKSKELNDIYYMLEDFQYELSRYSNNVEYDEDRLHEVSLIISKINKLEKKYSKDVNELIEYKNSLEKEIIDLENYDENYEIYKEERAKVRVDLISLAEKITSVRKKLASKLEILIQEELKFLYMEKSIVKIQVKDKDFGVTGKDDIKILISANLGEPLKSLTKVASGGELSRIMLALKIIFSNSIDAISIIFDEIDTGISGRVSQRMAEKMYQLATKSQVLCISHLPQTTALADNNMLISKEVINNRTISNIIELSSESKILEIARMISGSKTTKLAKDHALELIRISKTIKEEYNNNKG